MSEVYLKKGEKENFGKSYKSGKDQRKVTISSRFLRFKSGTLASCDGNPVTRIRKGRSFSGRFRQWFKNFIGLGVCVRLTRPA